MDENQNNIVRPYGVGDVTKQSISQMSFPIECY